MRTRSFHSAVVEFELGKVLYGDGRRLAREIVGVVFGGDLHLRIGIDADEALRGGAVGAVGLEPDAALDGIDGVLEAGELRRR